MKRKVYLDGELGEKYGKELTMNVDSFADVFRCLKANFDDVKHYLQDCHEKGIGFLFKVGNREITADEELLLAFNDGDMYISPVPIGSRKSGVGKIVMAIIVAVITWYFGPEAGATATKLQAMGQAFGYTLAANLAIQGFNELLAPDPGGDQQDDSYLYQGTGQNIIEGDPVPVVYGKLRVPGRPVSMHVRNQSQRFFNPGTDQAQSGETDNIPNPVVPAPALPPTDGSQVIGMPGDRNIFTLR
jgi:predicted phage tail protein